METRFFAPGSLVANLDFVESIFGNAPATPYLPENDAALDPMHWTGHTGCIIPAPQLNGVLKRDLGLPAWKDATARQRRDGTCWKDPAAVIYNDGVPFKLTSRSAAGVVVTLISDNYFGYCKKEVKTQISFAANLLGGAERDIAGGAVVFPSYDSGRGLPAQSQPAGCHPHLHGGGGAARRPRPAPCGGGRVQDRNYPNICIMCRPMRGSTCAPRTSSGAVPVPRRRNSSCCRAAPTCLPSGYKVEMAKPDQACRWRLVGRDGRRPPLPQAVHRLRRRQVRDFQADLRRDLHRAALRQRLGLISTR